MSDPTTDPRPVRTAVSTTTTLAAIVAVIAVVLGFLILRDINNDSAGGSVTPGPTATDPVDTVPATTTTTAAPVTTDPPLVVDGYSVLVANASGVGGSAGKLTEQLKAKNFTMAEPTNAADGVAVQTTTIVYYLPGFEAGGAAVATILGGAELQPMPTQVPVDGGSLGSASVLVMVGTDQAGKKLPKKVVVPVPDAAAG